MCDAILHLVNHANFDIIVDSHLWIGPEDASSLKDLYPEVGRKDTEGAMLIPELLNALYNNQRQNVIFVPTYNYSSFVSGKLDEVLRSHNITDVYITGINTDYCVFAPGWRGWRAHK